MGPEPKDFVPLDVLDQVRLLEQTNSLPLWLAWTCYVSFRACLVGVLLWMCVFLPWFTLIGGVVGAGLWALLHIRAMAGQLSISTEICLGRRPNPDLETSSLQGYLLEAIDYCIRRRITGDCFHLRQAIRHPERKCFWREREKLVLHLAGSSRRPPTLLSPGEYAFWRLFLLILSFRLVNDWTLYAWFPYHYRDRRNGVSQVVEVVVWVVMGLSFPAYFFITRSLWWHYEEGTSSRR